MHHEVLKAYNKNDLAGTVVNVYTEGPCRFMHIDIFNTTAAIAYLQIFNLPAASVTIGTTAPILTYHVAASGKHTIAPGDYVNLGGSGFSIASTTTDTGSTGATMKVNIIY